MVQSAVSRKTLPHSAESERAVLAGLLLDPGRLPCVSERLTAETGPRRR